MKLSESLVDLAQWWTANRDHNPEFSSSLENYPQLQRANVHMCFNLHKLPDLYLDIFGESIFCLLESEFQKDLDN